MLKHANAPHPPTHTQHVTNTYKKCIRECQFVNAIRSSILSEGRRPGHIDCAHPWNACTRSDLPFYPKDTDRDTETVLIHGTLVRDLPFVRRTPSKSRDCAKARNATSGSAEIYHTHETLLSGSASDQIFHFIRRTPTGTQRLCSSTER